VVLNKGEIAEIGTRDELLARQGQFYRLAMLQA
jgi:ABC-type multidrug transport system fused ATPase/permease subunit